MRTVNVSVLGPLLVECDGVARPIRPGLPLRALLCLLATDGAWWPVDRLVEELWHGAPPPSGARALHTHLGVLRRGLGPDAERLVAGERQRGYRFATDATWVDLRLAEREFRLDVAEARRALAQGDDDVALAALDRGLGRWRSDRAYAELEDSEALDAHVVELVGVRRWAEQQRIDLWLRRGEAGLAIPVLEAELAARPDDQVAVGQLMRAYAASGRPQQASACYGALVRVLRDRFGDLPLPELVELDRKIVSGDPSLVTVPRGMVRVVATGPVLAGPSVGFDFQVRPELVEQLPALPHRGASVQTVIVRGMAGVGKTQLVASWFAAVAPSYGSAMWIKAETDTTVDALSVADRLGVAPGLDAGDRLEALRRRLAEASQPWLVVLDNLPSSHAEVSMLPATGPGTVVITTRDRRPRDTARHVDVGLFDRDLAMRLLDPCGVAGEAASELARELGMLPLAIAQAAAYCRSTGTSLETYRELFAAVSSAELFEGEEAALAAYRQTVASTWRLSLDAAGRRSPLAEQAQLLCAVVASEDIPVGLFDALVQDTSGPSSTPGNGPSRGAANLKAVADAVGALHRYSLVERSGPSVSMHRLLQRVIREQSDAAALQRAVEVAVGWFEQRCGDPQLPEQWPRWAATVPHVQQLASACPGEVGSALAVRVAGVLNGSTEAALHGQFADCVALAERAAAQCARLLGDGDPATLQAQANLAAAFWAVGRYEDAIEVGRRNLAEREAVLGSDDPETLFSRNNLAGYYWAAGHCEQSLELVRQTLDDRTRVLGAQHPQTLATCGNLASCYRALGRFDEAIELGRAALAGSAATLGPTHPDTLFSRGGLAATYLAVGRYEDAVELERRTLTDRELVLGVEHPHTLTSRATLAAACAALGRLDEAMELGERALADRERVLGPTHPDTLASQQELAGTYRAAGRHSESLVLLAASVDALERVLGADHRRVVEATATLRSWRAEAQRLQAATVPLGERGAVLLAG